MRLFRAFSIVPDLLTGHNIQRFYKSTGVIQTQSGFQITLDSRPIFTPKKQNFVVKNELLALSIAQEWDQQDKFISKKKMPLVISKKMNLCSKAIDLHILKLRPEIKAGLVEILKNDSICFREEDPNVKNEQEKVFTPIHDHMKEKYDIELPVTFGLNLPCFDTKDVDNLEELIDSKDDFYVVALEAIANTSLSVSVAVALLDGIIDTKQAVYCSRIEDTLQAALYGKVEGEHDVKETQENVIMAAAKLLVTLSA